jgi:predicted permease
MRVGVEVYRSVRSAPAVWAGVILSIALGTGANIALFSVVNALMLRPLPVRDPAQLVVVGGASDRWSYPIWREIQGARGLFAGTAAWAGETFNTVPRGRAELANGLFVSGDFFQTLGVEPVRGRLIGPDDDRKGGGASGPVAVISHRYWQRRFLGAEDAIGRTIQVDAASFTIVGVTARDFLGPEVGTAFDVAVPLGMEPLVRKLAFVEMPGAFWLTVMARLAPGERPDVAAERLQGFQAGLRERLASLGESQQENLMAALTLSPAGSGISSLREQYRRPMLVLGVVAVLVLAIACANVANLLTVRAMSREKERALRMALGASTGALVREMLAESAVLIGIGCAAGTVVAQWAAAALVMRVNVEGETAVLDVSTDWRVLAFACAVASFTLLVSSLIPAFRTARVDRLAGLTQHGARIGGATGYRAAHSLLVLQVAFTTVLLVAAGLFIRTFNGLLTQPLGVERERVLVARVEPHVVPSTPERAEAFYDELRRAASSVPGVEDAGLSAMTPMGGTTIWQLVFDLPDSPLTSGTDARTVTANVIGPGFFRTFGTRVIAGRELSTADDRRAPPVALVNQAFVNRYLGGVSPVGRRIRHVGLGGRPSVDREIVGVVENAAYVSLREMERPTMYVPLAQRPTGPLAVFVSVRAAAGHASFLANPLVDALSSAVPDATYSTTTLEANVDAGVAQERLVAQLSGFFGVLALVLAGFGLYGVTAHMVGRRRAEVGIRLAIGATPSNIVALVLRRVAALVTAGIAAGVIASLWASPLVASLLYGLPARDVPTIAIAAALVAAVGAIAGIIPSVRAALLDPAAVLRRD